MFRFLKNYFLISVISAILVSLLPITSMAQAADICAPTTDKLHLYLYSTWVEVTNHGGAYDASNNYEFDYTRKCRVAKITKILVRDSFATYEYQSNGYGRFETKYTNLGVSNCWQIARVSEYGQSEWSNQVCYTAPLIQPVSVSGIYMYLNSSGEMDGNVYINWSKGQGTSGLYWTTCPPTPNWSPSNPNWSYEQSATGTSGQTIFSSHTSLGPRCYLVAAKSPQGILSSTTRVEYNYEKWMAQPYSSSPNYVSQNPERSSLEFSSGTSITRSARLKDCVGICYGVPSKVNGLPRNNYVSGYFRKDGTYVPPYTRSK